MTYNKNESDPIRLYLKDINKYSHLTRAQENELGKRILEGDKDSIKTLINYNLKFVIKIAKEYQGSGLPFEDLISEGNIGLMRAAELFDYRKKVKFSTYSAWWIRQSILKSISNKARMIRIPIYLIDLIHNIFRVRKELNGMATYKEVSEGMKKFYNKNISAKKIKDLINFYQGCLSLESEKICEDIYLKDTIEDKRINVETKVMNDFLGEDISKLIQKVIELNKKDRLIERDIDIFLSKCGFYDGAERTFEDVGKDFNITYERVRQIVKKIHKRIGKKKEFLRDYLYK